MVAAIVVTSGRIKKFIEITLYLRSITFDNFGNLVLCMISIFGNTLRTASI